MRISLLPVFGRDSEFHNIAWKTVGKNLYQLYSVSKDRMEYTVPLGPKITPYGYNQLLIHFDFKIGCDIKNVFLEYMNMSQETMDKINLMGALLGEEDE